MWQKARVLASDSFFAGREIWLKADRPRDMSVKNASNVSVRINGLESNIRLPQWLRERYAVSKDAPCWLFRIEDVELMPEFAESVEEIDDTITAPPAHYQA